MRLSRFFLSTQRQTPKDAETVSHRLCIKSGLLNALSAGIFSYLPLGLMALRKIENIIREYMNMYDGQEVLLPALQPLEIWQKTGRDKVLEEIMFTFKDRRGRDICLGPTHEEVITDLAKKFISSYKQMPVILYQIQTKFRDEIRPKAGLVRSCEFIMKDAYSFDRDQEGLNLSYSKMKEAYQNIFRECGLPAIILGADTGAMGGSESEEFLVKGESGEDKVFFCPNCGRYFKQRGSCPVCAAQLEEINALEIGHIFKLGTKYSQALGAYFLDADGRRKEIIMGCYGIGVSRLIPAVIENNYDQEGIIWPKKIAPFDVEILVLGQAEDLVSYSRELYGKISSLNYDVLLDDRNESVGVKFNDAYLLGMPYLFVLGKGSFSQGKVEIVFRKNKQKILVNKESVLDWARDYLRK